MTQSLAPRCAARAPVRTPTFKLRPVAVGCALLALGSADLALAQQAAQEVMVTGIRRGIESAISVKKNSDSIVEAISAEDIGKLPDTSIAESIARLPGIAAQRTNGRATGISVRGFAPDFTNALLNGREQVSTGDSRYVEFDQYPSELMNGVTVYKTPDGALIGQGLSATIDMKTARPLDFTSRVVSANVRKEQLGVGLQTAKGDGTRANLAYIDQFADRTIGLAVAYARLDETTGVSSNFGSWGVNDVCPVAQNADNKCPVATQGKAPGGFNDLVDQTKQTREAVMATLQYKPNKNFSTTLDVFYTKFDQNLLEQGLQVPLAPAFPGWGQNYGGTAVSNTTVNNGVITAGTINGFKAVSRNDSTATHDKVHSLGWNTQFKVADWAAAVDLASSEAKRISANIQTTAGQAGNCKATPSLCGSVSWTGFDGNSVTSPKYTTTVGLGDTSANKLTDVEGWGGGASLPQAGYSSQPMTDDKLNAYRFNVKRNLPEGMMFTDVELGLSLADRKKTRTYIEGRLLTGAATDPYAAVSVPGASTAIAPGTGLPYVAWNPDGSIGPIYTVASKLVPDIANKNWLVSEKVTTTYAKLGVDNTLMGLPVRGNLGVQLVHTNQSSTAFNTDGTACPGDVCTLRSNTAGAQYYDVLPSLNLAADLGNEQTLRLGLGRQMARPTLDDLRASVMFSVNATQGLLTGSAGNPALKPFRANTLDLSYEKYFGNKGYVSVAGFYKQLSTYVIKSINANYDFSPFVTAATPLPGTGSKTGIMTQPVNGSGGRVSGLELAASMPLDKLSNWLDGFGVQASYSYTDSAVVLPITGFTTGNISSPTIPLPGLSKHVGGLTFYYEKYGFSARVAQRYRSDFIGNVPSFAGDVELVQVKAEKITDLQLGYDFHSGPVKGLSILLQVNNLTNTPYIEYGNSVLDERKHVNYGKTYLFGLNYKI